ILLLSSSILHHSLTSTDLISAHPIQLRHLSSFLYIYYYHTSLLFVTLLNKHFNEPIIYMEIVKKRRLNEIILGFFLLSHPVPVMFHIIAVTLFTLLAAWQHPVWSVIVLVIAAHTAMQVSIAMINDYC